MVLRKINTVLDTKFEFRQKKDPRKIIDWRKFFSNLIKLTSFYSVNIFQRKFSCFYHTLFINYFNIFEPVLFNKLHSCFNFTILIFLELQ